MMSERDKITNINKLSFRNKFWNFKDLYNDIQILKAGY